MKFAMLDKKLLNKLYIDDNLQGTQIMKSYDISKTHLYRLLKKFNISKRINTKLSNKKELEDLYLNQKLSMKEIAIKHNTSLRLVNRRMKKFYIPSRTYSESIQMSREKEYGKYNILNLNSKQKQILDGLIFSDGYLKGKGTYTSNYVQSCKYKEFLKHIQLILPLGYNCDIYERFEKGGFGNNQKYQSYYLSSLGSKYLLKERKRWYPNGKKIIPKDFKLTNLSLLYLFLGDGSYGSYKKHKRYKSLIISSQSFTKEENEFFVKLLLNLGIEATINCRDSKHHYVRIRNKSIEKFFKIIGSCPVKCYEYKWGKFKEVFS